MVRAPAGDGVGFRGAGIDGCPGFVGAESIVGDALEAAARDEPGEAAADLLGVQLPRVAALPVVPGPTGLEVLCEGPLVGPGSVAPEVLAPLQPVRDRNTAVHVAASHRSSDRRQR